MLNEGDKAIVKEIALEASTAIKEDLVADFKVQFKLHQLECPIKDKVEAIEAWPTQAKMFSRGFLLGIVAVAALVGGSASLAIEKIVKALS